MHGQAFAERTRLADQYAAPVAQRAVERFHDAGLATALGTGPVGSGRQHRRVRFPGIGVIRRIVLITSRQLLEEPPARSRAPAPQHPAHDAPRGAHNGQPQPDFTLALADEGPHFVQLQHRRRPFRFGPAPDRFNRRCVRRFRQGFFLPTPQSSSATRPWPAQCCVANCVPPTASLPARIAWHGGAQRA